MFSTTHSALAKKKKTLFCLKKKLKQIFESKWLSNINSSKSKSLDINSGNKLRTYMYATFKCQFSCEPYINSLKFQERQALCKLRTTAHTPVCNRICKQCNTGYIEDQQHFL